MPSVLFVCLGNICRSPLVEGVMKNILKEQHITSDYVVDSAATSNYHVGETPDINSQKCAIRHGFDISSHHSRQVTGIDFNSYNIIVAMDGDNLESLQCQKENNYQSSKAEIVLLSSFIPGQEGKEVPDAYYARDKKACYEEIYGMAVAACPNIIEKLEML